MLPFYAFLPVGLISSHPLMGLGLGCLLMLCGGYVGYSFARRTRRKDEDQTVRSSEPALADRADNPVVAGLSHEIRTPLNGIAGMTNFLAQSNLDEGQHECVQTIQSCVDALLTLVNDILDYSKIESGHVSVECIDFDLRSSLEDALDVFTVQAQGRGVALYLDIPEDTSLLFRGDPYRLRQIALNFVSNAIKFTKTEGQVTLALSLEEDTEKSARVRISVIDTGIGIPESKLGVLFTPFEQADSSTTREYGGTGLGLAISRGLAECMGGEVGMDSTLGEGSTFWFELELERQSSCEAPPVVDFEGASAVVVDSNTLARELLVRQLEAWKMSVVAVASLEDLEEQLAGSTPRVAFFDEALLDQDVSKWAKRVASRSGKQTSLCLLRNKTIQSSSGAELGASFSHTLFKPLKQRQLLDTLNKMLSGDSASISEVPAALPSESTEQRLEETSFRRRVRILVVDDNSVNRLVAQKMLLKLGYQAELVVDGKEAVDAVGRSPFDLIFMDRQMPVMDGIEATRIIREREGDGRRTPIVALTADGLESARDECLAAGMDDFLVKPVTGEELASKITRWVNCAQV